MFANIAVEDEDVLYETDEHSSSEGDIFSFGRRNKDDSDVSQ